MPDKPISWADLERYGLTPREEIEIARGKSITEILHERARVEEAQRPNGTGQGIGWGADRR